MATRTWTIAATAAALLLFGLTSCQKGGEANASSAATASDAKITRVVFIDKKNAKSGNDT